MLTSLSLESFAQGPKLHDEHTISNTKNIGLLLRFISATNILECVFQHPPGYTPYNPRLLAVQLLLMHWSLLPEYAFHTYSFAHSQQAVYGTPNKFPIFTDTHMRNVNIEYLLHIANFFKYHITRSEEHTLFTDFCALDGDERPIPWTERLESGVKEFGKHWMGSYGKAYARLLHGR